MARFKSSGSRSRRGAPAGSRNRGTSWARATRAAIPPSDSRQPARLPTNTPSLEVVIERVGARGDGVATANVDGQERSVFVPFSLPGERLLVKPLQDRGEGVACRIDELSDASPDRMEPACPHFMDCGGCAVQHMPTALYAAWKQSLVTTALSRAGLAEVTVSPIALAAPGQRRRADFVVQRLRDKVVIGFHERDGNRVVDIEACAVLAPEIVGLLEPMRAAAKALLKAGDRAAFVANLLDTGIDALLVLPREPDRAGLEVMATFAEEGDLARLSWRAEGRRANGPVPASIRREAIARFADVEVSPPPSAFLQATGPGEAAIVAALLEAAGEPGREGKANDRAVDLFSGCGTLAFPLARVLGLRVLAVDGDASAVASLRTAADRAGLGARVETAVRNLFERPLSADELSGVDIAVFDPPRAGARAQAEALAASSVPTVVAVSCNPATLARDARVLVDGGYRLERVMPIDQFLWTPHVEIVAVFRRAEEPGAGGDG
jgi:23S rRNA (uracil1939-C5)-methyltransferase